nr:immunoglobulin heavy chain junction region [Mus musculus]
LLLCKILLRGYG